MLRRPENLSLRALVTTYISALEGVRTAKDSRPILATDLSLYLGRVTPWFDNAMSFWADYVSDEVKLGPLMPPSKRRVVRYVPLRQAAFGTISQAQEYWLKVKAAMHWLLVPGPYHLVTFGELRADELSKLNYCVVPTLLVESPGIFDGDFETRVEHGSGGAVRSRAELVEQFFPDRSVESVDPDTQVVFPLYYTQENFRSPKLGQYHLRQIFGRFLWKLQAGICPPCGLSIRYNFDDMEVDHVLAWRRGGNNTLLNLEMKCHDHNHPKNARLSETSDYLLVVQESIGAWRDLAEVATFVRQLFSIRETRLEFPVSFRFGVA